MRRSGEAPEVIVEREGLTQVADSAALEAVIDQVLAGNPKPLDDCSTPSFDCLCFGPARVAIHVPENCPLRHFALRYTRHDPASRILVVFVVAVANRPAIASTTPRP